MHMNDIRVVFFNQAAQRGDLQQRQPRFLIHIQLMVDITIALQTFDQVIFFIGAGNDDRSMAIFNQSATQMKNAALGLIML